MTTNSGTDNKETFVAPLTEEVSGKDPVQPEQPEKKTKEEQKETTKDSKFEAGSTVIGVKQMVDTKDKIATKIMIERIQHHMKFLTGKLSFPDTNSQVKEQISFIETIGNSLKLDYDQFIVVTNELLNQIKDNKDAFVSGTPFRFMSVLDKHYSPDIVKTYQSYIIFLTKLANNWSARYKLNKLVDIAFVTQDMDRKSKENLTKYFQSLINS